MIVKLKKGTVPFRNPQLLAVDTKRVVLERVLTNLFRLIYADGAVIKSRFKKEHNMESLQVNVIGNLEEEGHIIGASEHPDAVQDWLRSSLVELVSRGNLTKENIASLRPVHLLSFRIQNRKYCRDYSTADQLYLMLKSSPEILNSLREYLRIGWDLGQKSIVPSMVNDVDTLAVLLMTSKFEDIQEPNKTLSNVKPLLEKQTDLFNDDIRRLLAYQNVLPRTVFIDYFKILCGMHLALYTMKLVYLLPKMISAGTTQIEDDWSMVVDLTDNLESKISRIACLDAERMLNDFRSYIRATYCIDLVQNGIDKSNKSVEEALNEIKQGVDQSEFKTRLSILRQDLPESDEKSFDQKDLDELLEYYDDNDYFGKFVHVLEVSNLGNSQYKYLREFIDAVTMKNSPSMLLADGRSRKHPRRGALGSKLLETLVQLLVLEPTENGSYESRSLSIDELAQSIRDRYGLIINGVNEKRFADADVETNAAFAENVNAFKNKLRQTGFYTDLSDACILQKIRPRYKL